MVRLAETLGSMKRSHYCGEIRETEIDRVAVLMGWAQRRRDLGGVIFIDLRDNTGIAQVVIDARNVEEADFIKAERIRGEYVIAVEGVIEKRDPETVNPLIETGTIELRASKIKILSEAKTPPFAIEERSGVREELRLKHRYLDLRRPDLYQNLKLRQQVAQSVRQFLTERRFLEVETPVLTKSTPEGARDYLVPSRVFKGSFYALPQSPQIYKQLLMVGGVDRYFQVARCFRDEDLRADRQPEFTQVDLEMSFVDENDVTTLLETLFAEVFREVLGVEVPLPMPRMTWQEAMDRYGADKPDLRFGMEIVDLTDIAAACSFDVFRRITQSGGVVRAINAKGYGDLTRSEIEMLTQKAVGYGGKGMAWIAIRENGELYSVLTKFFKEDELRAIMERLGGEPGDFIIFSADTLASVRMILGALRLDLADLRHLRKKEDLAFLIVTDFPLLEWDGEENRYVAMHHPFTMPAEEDLPLLETNPLEVRAKAYDVVLNGVELGSGSIRIHLRDLQKRMFKLLGFTEASAQERFGFMLDAFQYGAPPHGGFAFGLDRLMMLMVGADSIRDVIAFPKMRDGSCAMSQSPSKVSSSQLRELDLLSGLKDYVHVEPEKPQVSEEQVDYVAGLARLSLSEDEKEELTQNLRDIIAFADKLNELDVTGLDPMAHVMPVENVFRADVPGVSDSRDLVLKNAPAQREGCYFVPKAVE